MSPRKCFTVTSNLRNSDIVLSICGGIRKAHRLSKVNSCLTTSNLLKKKKKNAGLVFSFLKFVWTVSSSISGCYLSDQLPMAMDTLAVAIEHSQCRHTIKLKWVVETSVYVRLPIFRQDSYSILEYYFHARHVVLEVGLN